MIFIILKNLLKLIIMAGFAVDVSCIYDLFEMWIKRAKDAAILFYDCVNDLSNDFGRHQKKCIIYANGDDIVLWFPLIPNDNGYLTLFKQRCGPYRMTVLSSINESHKRLL